MQNQAIIGALCCAFLGYSTCASADKGKPAAGHSMQTITPIYSQLLQAPLPQGFHPSYESAKPTVYTREAVLSGETVEQWSQMITITGLKDLARNPNATPKNMVFAIASGFEKACPESFSTQALQQGKLGGYDAFTAVVQCGTSPTTNGRTSESALITAIKGTHDYYTIQWAERSKPSSTPLPVNRDKWIARYQRLVAPVRLCDRKPGEAPPYPSCTNAKPE